VSPLVTVVTSTWHRPQTLIENAVKSVAGQDYPEIEHVVVIDGPDDWGTVTALYKAGYSRSGDRQRIITLGRNWSSYSGDGGYGATCRLVGAWMAAGDLITYLDDDNVYAPEHISEMVAMFDLETDFVTCSWSGPVTQPPGPPPGLCRSDTSTIMHRALVLRDAGGFHPDGYAGDGNMVERWLAKGLTWKYKDKPTVHFPNGSNHGRDLG
jgi:glycosyltransferase involved in cell wall biosynthesis